MKELSLNILDISENSVKAGATLVEITVNENSDFLSISIKDDGCGMSDETVKSVINPFYTTRTTRSVGLGIPLLKMAAEQTGGRIEIFSREDDGLCEDHGTVITAHFFKNHIDFTPLGDVISTVTTLIQGHPDIDFLFIHNTPKKSVVLDTREIRAVLIDVPLDSYEVLTWIKEFLEEQYSE